MTEYRGAESVDYNLKIWMLRMTNVILVILSVHCVEKIWIFVNFIVYRLKRHLILMVIRENSTDKNIVCFLHSLYLNSIKILHTIFDTH